MSAWVPGAVILGEYTIERELGHGGMGRVWLVKSNSTGRRYAVKQTILKDEKTRKAFLEELQTWIDLPEHPNIVPCRFFRTVGDEIVIFTDYIEGGSLKDWIDQGKLSTLEQILDVAIQFAWGIHAIHERGLIHQDVKPGNVLMTAEGVPMVADFGLARARQVAWDGEKFSSRQPNGQHSVLVPGSGFMTKAYASPEQKAGQPLSRKTDIWSWGVSVLDMFMGGVSCPHGGHIAAEVLAEFAIHCRTNDTAIKPTSQICYVLQKCFAHSIDDRWDSIYASILALDAAGASVASMVTIQGDTHFLAGFQSFRRHKGDRWVQPSRFLRDVYSAVNRNFTGGELSKRKSAHMQRGSHVADVLLYEEAEKVLAHEIKVGGAHLNEMLALLYENKALLLWANHDHTGALALYDRAISIYEGRSHSNRLETVRQICRAQHNKGVLLTDMGNHTEAITVLNQCINMLRLAHETAPSNDLLADIARALLNKANVMQYVDASVDSIVTMYDQCIAAWRAIMKSEPLITMPPEMAYASVNRLNAISKVRQVSASEWSDSVDMLRATAASDTSGGIKYALANAMLQKADGLLSSNESICEAIKCYDECIAILSDLSNSTHHAESTRLIPGVWLNSATASIVNNDYKDAAVRISMAINLWEHLVHNDGHTDLAYDLSIAYMNKGNVCNIMGQHGDALGHYDRCLTLLRSLMKIERDNRASNMMRAVCGNKASALKDQGDKQLCEGNHSEAESAYKECIAIIQSLPPNECTDILHCALISASTAMAQICFTAGRLEKAIEWATCGITYCQKNITLIVDASSIKGAIDLINQRGLMHHEFEQHAHAIADYQLCISYIQQSGASEYEYGVAGIARSFMNMGRAYGAQGDHDQSVTCYDKAVGLYANLDEITNKKYKGENAWTKLLRAYEEASHHKKIHITLVKEVQEAYRIICEVVALPGGEKYVSVKEWAEKVFAQFLWAKIH